MSAADADTETQPPKAAPAPAADADAEPNKKTETEAAASNVDTASNAGEGDSNDNKEKRGGSGGGSGDKKRRDRKNGKDEAATPIEELYDLSRPIPHVPRPSKDEHEAALSALNGQIDALKEQRAALQSQIDAGMGGKGQNNRNPRAESLKDELRKLRAAKGALIDAKKALRSKLEAVRAASDKIEADRKKARSAIPGNGKFTSLQSIEAEISRLARRQETTSMSLQDEKRLLNGTCQFSTLMANYVI